MEVDRREEEFTQTIDFDGDLVHRSWTAEEYDKHNEDEEETAENVFTEVSDPERIDDIPDEKSFRLKHFNLATNNYLVCTSNERSPNSGK